MPRKNEFKAAPKAIARAIKRHLEGGEPASAIAKELRVSRATVYLWIGKYKQEVLNRKRPSTIAAPKDLKRADRGALIAEIEALRDENRKLRDRLVTEMLRSGTSRNFR